MNNQKIFKALKKIYIFSFVFLVIAVMWEIIDIVEFGKPQPSISDTFFGFVLADLISKNYFGKEKT